MLSRLAYRSTSRWHLCGSLNRPHLSSVDHIESLSPLQKQRLWLMRSSSLYTSTKNNIIETPDVNRENYQKREPIFLIFPEILDDTPENNEFLRLPPTSSEIPFSALNVEKCVRAAGKQSIELEHFLDEYSQSLKSDFSDRGVSNAKFCEFVTGCEQHLMPLHYTLNLLLAFRTIRPKEFAFRTFDEFIDQRMAKARLRYQNRSIYTFMCELKARRETELKESDNETTDEEWFLQQQKNQLVDRYIREAKLFGLGLNHQDQLNLFNLVNEKLLLEQRNFVNTAALASTIFQSSIISPQFLDCLPDHVITQINHHDHKSVFNSFMRYCPDQNLRKDFWLSYYSRAAPYMESKLNNFLVIEKIREARYRKAKLLGYENFAQMVNDLRGSGGPTMAGHVENIRAFINGLGSRTEARFEQNFKELTDFATMSGGGVKSKRVKSSSGKQQQLQKEPQVSTTQVQSQPPGTNQLVEKLNLWDLKYFERAYLREMYRIDSRDVRAHFPLERVLSGMLEHAEQLFKLKIVERKDAAKSGWGANVRHFVVYDNSGKSAAEYGSFYFDPFQRESKILLPISRSESYHTKPVVFFLMNFTAGAGSIFDQYDQQQLATGKELLNFSQVIELFSKFGFVLQHLLTQVNFSEIGSVANIEADAFQIVSHFMRHWPLNSYQTLARCSSHIKTGEPISEEFFQRIQKSYYHFVSFSLKYELYLMALDHNLHTLRDHVITVQKQTWNEWMQPFEAIPEDGHVCSFMELFAGNGLEGIYYSDKWAEVIAADLFDAFRDARSGGMKSPEAISALGERFKDTFLAKSGAVETNELFRRFLGRDPTLNGYLSINGFE